MSIREEVIAPSLLSYMVGQMLQKSTTCIFIFNDIYLCSTRYTHIQHFIFIFNNAYFLSTSTKIIFIQQKYLFNFNCHIYLILNKNNCSTSIQTFSFNKNHDFFVSKVPGDCKFLHSTKYPVPPHRPIPYMEPIPFPAQNLIHSK